MTKMKLNDGEVAVIEAMFDGCNTISGLTERLGQSPFTIRAIVRELELNGIVSKVSRGHSPKLLINMSDFEVMKNSSEDEHLRKLDDICEKIMDDLIHVKMCHREDKVIVYSVKRMMEEYGLIPGRDSADVDSIMSKFVKDGYMTYDWYQFKDGMKQRYLINWDKIEIPETEPESESRSSEDSTNAVIPPERMRYRSHAIKVFNASRINLLIPKEWKISAIKLLKFDGNEATFEIAPNQ